MKIEDCIDKMSKSHLEKVVKSFTKEHYYNKDEEGYKKQIINNIDVLSDPINITGHIKEHINSSKHPYQDIIFISFILRRLLSKNDYRATQEEIFSEIKDTEQDIILKSKEDQSYSHIDPLSLKIFKAVLETAFDDGVISYDELNLIIKLREHLKLQEKDQFLIQASINHFPQKNNQIHTPDQVKKILNDLQRCGVIFFCNKPEQFYLIPEEFIRGIKEYLNIELVEDKYRKLLDTLNVSELKDILSSYNLKASGKKEDLTERILLTGINPGNALNNITNRRLSEICKKLPDVKSSGQKAEKINRIIKYYDELINIDVRETEDKREIYYDFFEQLAKVDMQNLMGKNIVKNESECKLAFEEATRFIFEKKFSQELLDQKGTNHCDGCMELEEKDDFFMWDNKTKYNSKYDFPNKDFDQFKRYIRDAKRNGKSVKCFLIVAPGFEDSVQMNAERLKYESGIDTDIALISASNLKWIAEEWNKNYSDKKFNLHLFNKTTVFTKDEIKNRMKLFL